MLDGVSKQHLKRSQENRKRKREKALESVTHSKRQQMDEKPSSASEEPTVSVESHSVLQHITVGINEVTKRLETHIRDNRRITVKASSTPTYGNSRATLGVVLVCRADIDPPILIDHIPPLIAIFNSTQPKHPIKVVLLPKGAETSLAQAMGLRRAAVLGLDVCVPSGMPLF